MYVISIKFVRASGVNFHTLPNKNNAQIGSSLVSHVFTLNTAFPGHGFICRKTLVKREIWPRVYVPQVSILCSLYGLHEYSGAVHRVHYILLTVRDPDSIVPSTRGVCS